MPADFLATIDDACKSSLVAFAAKRPIFRQGDAVRWLHVVTAGRVRLSRVLARGAEITLAQVGAGQLLAEAALFAARHHCNAVAETACELRRYSARDVLALLERNTAASTTYGAYLARELMDLRAVVEIRAIRRADERLLAWLRLRARGTPPTYEAVESWPGAARQIGLTPESMYRALAALERAGKIDRDARRVALSQRL